MAVDAEAEAAAVATAAGRAEEVDAAATAVAAEVEAAAADLAGGAAATAVAAEVEAAAATTRMPAMWARVGRAVPHPPSGRPPPGCPQDQEDRVARADPRRRRPSRWDPAGRRRRRPSRWSCPRTPCRASP